MIRFGLIATIFFAADAATAQSVSGRVTGAVGGASAAAGVATGSPISGVSGDSFSGAGVATGGSSTGGGLDGGLGVKLGDKVVKFRGAVGVGEDRSNAKIGAAVPF